MDKMYEQNLLYFKELSMYIQAGKLSLSRMRDGKLKELEEKAKITGLPEDAQAAKDLDSKCARFEKKLHDLELTRMISLQTAPQIRLVQNNDTMMAEKIQTTLVNTIPLWKSQMAAALGLARATDSLRMQQKFNIQAERGIRSGARELNAQASAYSDARGESDDRQRAQQTADALLDELHDIEQSLAEQQQIRRARQNSERGV